MNLVLETLRTLNLATILLQEFYGFIETHQASLQPLHNEVFNGVKAFFTREVFPLAETWINNVSAVSVSEVKSTLNITIDPDRILNENDRSKIMEKLAMSEKINDVRMLEEMEKRTKNFKNIYSFNLQMFLPIWWMGVKEAWHKAFLGSFMTSSKNGFLKKLQISAEVVNLTDKEIPKTLLNVLTKGNKYIPQVYENAARTTKRVETEIVKQAWWYSKKIEKKVVKIPNTTSAAKTIETLMNKAKTSKDKTFYRTLLDGLNDIHHSTASNIAGKTKEDEPTAKTLKSLSIIEDCVWNLADKNRGLVLLPSKFVRDEEIKMMIKLDAVKINQDTKTVLYNVASKESSLRMNLDNDQSRLVRDFPAMKLTEIQMPFLKIRAKLHKLSEDQIKRKDIGSLSFRPVNDSMFFVTKPLSKCLLVLLRELNTNIISRFQNLNNLLPTSGWAVSEHLQNTTSFCNTRYSVFYSCDLSDAYSNCTLDDLMQAAAMLYRLLGGPDMTWKLDLVSKLATFVLSNSFIEAGGFIWKCGLRLPMGCCASGEALDTICLAGEVANLCTLTTMERSLVPTYLTDIEKPLTIDVYQRYRDDTRTIDSSNDASEILNNLVGVISKTFPPHIPVSLELSVFYGSFLDCVFFRNYSTNSFTTTTRLNLSAPSTMVNSSSSSPFKYLTAPFLSNAIRSYRITNDHNLFMEYIGFLKMEMKKANYTDEAINTMTNKALHHIYQKLDKHSLLSHRSHKNPPYSCEPTVYCSLTNSAEIIIDIVTKALRNSDQTELIRPPGITLRNKTENIVFTKEAHRRTMNSLKE